ncbi:DegT/DnrJ/EryC1/StrS aminotransferase [Metarhizium acridum CQMa 102]|uniref:DegT/DnrJ/EryC1/StrS aminotransferase n=1 Tax=Metarhizium acridum (strain CQMa 102) TaxID=655827 RepID=E9E0T1_METAQ|nr:DegT/DnrJ/EryC1/StrS aminotransferase [Metarhizium acridum CQMa 102]EFY90485.1 DegT/DnrJ/EryC1/StrS aminotransferase [Metarhizium acridum CQMa 102]
MAYALLGMFDIQMPLIYGEDIPKAHLVVPFGKNVDIVGRGGILDEVMRKIPPATNDNTCQMTVIEGLGGVGKTQIAPLIVITASGSSQRMSFDYIIIGAGTSGLLVANRLSANSNTRVVLIEPSSDDRNNPNVTDPLNRDKISDSWEARENGPTNNVELTCRRYCCKATITVHRPVLLSSSCPSSITIDETDTGNVPRYSSICVVEHGATICTGIPPSNQPDSQPVYAHGRTEHNCVLSRVMPTKKISQFVTIFSDEFPKPRSQSPWLTSPLKDFILGPEVRELEARLADYSGATHVVTCGSGTAALTLALLALGLQPGDSVLVPDLSYPQHLTINPSLVDAGVTAATKAGHRAVGIIAVNLYSHPADYDALHEAAALHRLWVIGDAAQSFGGSSGGRRVGSLARPTTTSFFPSKPPGRYGDGGAVFTNDGEIAELSRSLRQHGLDKTKSNGLRIGLNGRLDTIQAAVLLCKLDLLTEEMIREKKWQADMLSFGMELLRFQGLAMIYTLPGQHIPYGLRSAISSSSTLVIMALLPPSTTLCLLTSNLHISGSR